MFFFAALLLPAVAFTQAGTVPDFDARINGAHVDGLDLHFDNPTINFTWSPASAPNGIEKYHVLLNEPGVGWVRGEVVNSPATSHTMSFTGLTDGGRFWVHIRAKEVGGTWGPFVNGGEFTVNVGPDNTPPNTPPNFVGRINGQNISGLTINTTTPTINFTWDHSEDAAGIERYFIVLNHIGVGWHQTQHVVFPGQSYNMPVTGLVDGGTYRIHIKAKDNSGNWSPFINGGEFTVQLNQPDNTPPPPVPNFVGTIGGQNVSGLITNIAAPAINFSWDEPFDPSGIEQYHVLLNRPGVGWVKSDFVFAPAVSHTMQAPTLVDGGLYRIHIKAKDNAGNWNTFINGGSFTVDLTNPSNVSGLSATINGQPISGLTVTDPTPTIVVNWNAASDANGIQNYDVILNRVGVGNVVTNTVTGTSHTLQAPALVDGAQYRIRVRARDNAGNTSGLLSVGNFTMDLGQGSCANCWSNPSAWPNNQVPSPGTNVTIPSTLTIQLDVDIVQNRIWIEGTLRAKRDKDVNITAKSIIVQGGNALMDWGTATDRYTRRSIITLTGNDPNDSLVNMGAKVLAAHMGGTIQMHGQVRKSWSRLGAHANKNSSTIMMSEVVDWEVGDSILIVPSRHVWQEVDQREIRGISGTTITLDQPLTYDHKGEERSYSQGGRTWNADLRAEVGLLTHNITVQGTPDPNGFGGHMMIHTNGYAYIDGIEFFHMGQKAKLARYPFHWHMLADLGGNQYLKNSAIRNSFNRAVTIHGTEDVLVENNFCFEHIGHGIFLEDGSERFNEIRGNVVLHTMRPAPGEELTPSDNQFITVQNLTPASFWITNPENTFEDNVAAGTQGTGFWFAFPRSPMGLSAGHPHFQGLQPHTRPLISFARNTAHSCGNGFDIFDQLSAAHAIEPNQGWFNNDPHIMDECTWYANRLALYTGIGTGGPADNLIFRRNALVQNLVGIMFASNSIVDESAIVADAGMSIFNGERAAYRVYDGPGQVHNSYFVGWNAPNANLLFWLGAATKHPNHRFINNVTNHPGVTPRCSLPNWDLPPAPAQANDDEHPRVWSTVIRDFTGGINGATNTNIVSNHPFQLVGDEIQPSNWTHAYRSTHEFALSRLVHGVDTANIPRIVCTREKAGTPTEHVYYIWGFRENQQLPFIVNEGFEYTYRYETLPISRLVRLDMLDTEQGDNFVARWQGFGTLPGIRVSRQDGGSITRVFNPTALRNATVPSYYIDTGGDVWVKPVADADGLQQILIRWNNTSYQPPKLDTDGDQMADGLEIISGRHPFNASDLAAEFATNGDFEGWDGSTNITGLNVSGGQLRGTSSGNGDATIVNNDFNFDATEVQSIAIRMRRPVNGPVQLFFATNTQGGFSGGRVVTAQYFGNGAYRTLAFDVAGHSAWTGTITDLRLDPVTVAGQTFDIEWIRGSNIPMEDIKYGRKTGAESSVSFDTAPEIAVWPNPVRDQLNVDLGQAGVFHTLQIVDLQGRVVRAEAIAADRSQLALSLADGRLPEGMYVVRLHGAAAMKTAKILIQAR